VGLQTWQARLSVAPDGRLWIGGLPGSQLPPGVSQTNSCSGVLSFDGRRWRQYLGSICVTDVAAAPDGTIWATSDTGSPDVNSVAAPDTGDAGLYVIEPEDAPAS
jgi:hypothetical protein